MSAFRCPKCDKITGGDEIFCNQCGESLNTTCTECGNVWRFMFEYLFCPMCGHKVKQADLHEESKETYHSVSKVHKR